MLEGPPGVGKSLIAMTLAAAYGETYVCTLTEQLQAQYSKDALPMGAKTLLGRGKFKCNRARATCTVGAQLYKGPHACGLKHEDGTVSGDANWLCPYRAAKREAFRSPLMLANYHSLMANVGMADAYREEGITDDGEEPSPVRPFLVLDEAHAIEGVLLDEVAVTINLSKISIQTSPLPERSADVPEYTTWLETFAELLKHHIKVIGNPEEKTEAEQLYRKVRFYLAVSSREQWIVERNERQGGEVDPNWFSLKPLTVKSFGHRVWRWGQKVLLMSATILDAKTVVESLGLDPEKGEFVQLPCIFPAENRPVYVGNFDMTFNAREESWPRMVRVIDDLMNRHPNEKGLLLTPSNKMLTYIQRGDKKNGVEGLSRKNAARLILAFGDDRTAKYNEHIKSKQPTILAASGYWEGADLKDEASAFQIIPQLPRAQWSGQIKARAEQDGTWYRWRTFCRFVQGLGRSVRHENDKAVSYVLDGEVRREAERKHGSLIPPWLKEALIYIDD